MNRISPEEFKQSDKTPLVVVLDNVRSLHNVGSVFRTGDAFLIEAVYLCGITSTPPHAEIHKTALGAEYFVVWKKEADLGNVITRLRASGYLVVGLEQDDRSVPLGMIRGSRSVALIVGNEVRGLDRRILARCDVIGELPMRGRKNSLNVSVACGIALYVFRGIIK